MNFEDTVRFGMSAYSSIHPTRAAELNQLFFTIGNGCDWIDGELVDTCGGMHYKNGKPMSLKAAISATFRRRRKQNKFSAIMKGVRTRQYNREKKNGTYKSDPETDKIMANFEAAMDANIKRLREIQKSDPAKYEAIQKQREDEHKALKRRIAESKRWEYAVPTNIDDRVLQQRVEKGAYGGYNSWYPMSEKYSACFDYDPATIKDDWLAGIIEACRLLIANPPVAHPHYDPQGTSAASSLALAKLALEKAMGVSRYRAGEIMAGRRMPLFSIAVRKADRNHSKCTSWCGFFFNDDKKCTCGMGRGIQ